MSLYYQDDLVTLHHGDCLDVLATLPDASIDSIVTDPPYELTANKKGGSGIASVNLDSPYGRSRIGTGNGGFMGKEWDATGIAHSVEMWQQCLRVLKPGGHLLAFGGTRTWHRLTCAIEDAGFEIRDSICWLYGSGFPKSLDVSKAIDKAAGAERTEGAREWSGGQRQSGIMGVDLGTQTLIKYDAPATEAAQQWQGWGTALKPAHEPIVVARKPLTGTVTQNVLAYGTGALNIDACRVGDGLGSRPRIDEASENRRYTDAGGTNFAATPGVRGGSPAGRWPANVVLDESQANVLDEQSGILISGSYSGKRNGDKFRNSYGEFAGTDTDRDAHPGSVGGASRFFYIAKAATSERPNVDDASHPTVKPLDLMRWLVRLVTPRGGVVLDPFLGSGTTAEACILEHFRCIGVEREATYLPLIVKRITKPLQPGFDFGDPA